MTTQNPIARGEHAKRLLEDELLNEAFEEVERDIFDEWRKTNSTQHSERAELFHTLKGLERLKGRLQAILDDALVAKSRS
jgi:hypothetical protein